MHRGFLLLCVAALACTVAGDTCGKTVDAWFAKQLDLLRTASDNTWTGTDAFTNVVAKAGPSFMTIGTTPNTATCPGTMCASTATLCGRCVSLDKLVAISLGYAATDATSAALWGAAFTSALTKQSQADAVAVGLYMRRKVSSGVKLADDVENMCGLLAGEIGNRANYLVYSGLGGDVTSQDMAYAESSDTTGILDIWEASTGLSMDDVAAAVVTHLSDAYLGSYLSWLSESSCSACSEAGSWSDVTVAGASDVRSQMLRMQERMATIDTRDIVPRATDKCAKYDKKSANYASCKKLSTVQSATKIAGVKTKHRDLELYGRDTRQPSYQCQVALYSMLMQLNVMVASPDICNPVIVAGWLNVSEVGLYACTSPQFLTILAPLLSFPQVLCNAQPLQTNITGPEVFRQLITALASVTDLYWDELPICIPGLAEIFQRENMDLVYDFLCSQDVDPNARRVAKTDTAVARSASPRVISGYWTCLRYYNETLADPTFTPVPTECLVPLTGSGVLPSGTALPDYCAAAIESVADRLGCCCYILDQMLRTINLQTGESGIKCPPCSAEGYITYEVPNLDYDKAVEAVGVNALEQVAFDEAAHRAQSLGKFITGVSVAPSTARRTGETDRKSSSSTKINFKLQSQSQRTKSNEMTKQKTQTKSRLAEMSSVLPDCRINSDSDIEIGEVTVVETYTSSLLESNGGGNAASVLVPSLAIVAAVLALL
eukprot:TRINITY_DN2402_c2_g1_i1.p1 TRINITY_DN2402_c2_g1~~TRINITY_DN2402_c2_g1_i1.p1  ORF type:complete len:718 (+),score=174.44 TRINITY_DN2402_c2_g1_i1:206-2359(+)